VKPWRALLSPAIGTLSARTERLVTTYLAGLQVDLHPYAILFRTRSGGPYGREPLAHDFAAVRALASPGDKYRLVDMPRSGVIEAIAGDAGPLGLAAKLANLLGDQTNSTKRTRQSLKLPTALPRAFEKIGAGEGNRTLVISLEGIWKSLLNQSRLRHLPRRKLPFWDES
jgi:hypothetical protein